MSNQVFIFQGTQEQVDETVTNPYYGQTFTLNGIYNVNTGTYNGTGTGNTLEMTNSTDAMFVLNSSNQQTISDVQRIITGNGNDFLDLASTTVNLGDISIFGGSGNETIWDGSGNDTITTGNGNNNIVGGTGNDIINGGTGSDTIYIGHGNNTVNSGGGDDILTYNVPQNLGSTDTFNGGTGTDTLTLTLTSSEYNTYAADITGAIAFVANNSNTASSTGPTYTFASLGLTISNVENINIVITANNNPVAHEDDFAGQQGHAVQGNLLANNGHGAASDPDGDAVAAVAGTLTTAHGGTAVINADGTFTYTPTAGFFGTDTFNYTVSDPWGATATGSAVISLNAPPVAQPANFSGQENNTVSGNLLSSASDPDGGVLSAAAGTIATSHGGSVALAANGTFTYTPTAGFFGTDSFNWTVSDGQGGTATGTVSVNINAPPVVQAENFNGQENQTVSGNLLSSASDPDGGVLTAVAGTIATSHGGSVALAANGTFTYTPAAGFFGADSFNWTVSDGQGGTAAGAVSVSVNAPPVAQQDDFTGTRDQAVTGNVLANNGHGADSDPDGDPLSVTAAIIATAAGGQVNLHTDGSFTYTGAAGYTGADSFTYALQDNHGGSATGTVDLTINAPAKLPPVAQEDDFFTPQGHAVAGNVLADNGHGADSDPNGDALSVIAATITTAAGGQVALNADGSFSYTPAAGYTGADTFTYTLANSDGLQSAGTVDLTVAAVAAQPHEFSSANVLFPAVIEGTNIAYLVPPGTPALGVLHGELDIGNATQATVTFEQSVAGYSNTLGSFVIAADGTIEDTNIVFANAHQQTTGEQYNINLPSEAGAQLGFFIIADGATANPALATMINSGGTLNFYYDYGQTDQRLANVNDSGTHVSLVYSDSGHDTVLQGNDYFTTERGGSMALNADDATHVVSGLASAGDTSQLRMSFEDLPNTGDADYNDVIFSLSMNSTTNTTTDAGGNAALVGSAGLYGAAPDKFNIDAVSSSPENIVDFKAGAGGDALDITNILHGYNSLSDLFSSFVEATSGGGNTTIAVNADGHAGGTFVPIAVIEGITATLADLVTDGNLLAAHSS